MGFVVPSYITRSTWLLPPLEISRKERSFSSKDAPSATMGKQVANTRPVPTCTVFSVARPARPPATSTPMPTKLRHHLGIGDSVRLPRKPPRNTSPAPRWCSPDSRNPQNEATSSPISKTPPNDLLESFNYRKNMLVGNQPFCLTFATV